MAVTSQLSRRYATALVDSVAKQGEGAIEKVSDELTRAGEAIDISADLLHVLENPVFSTEEKLATLKGVIQKLGLSETAARFLELMVERDRGALIPEVAEAVRVQADDLVKRVRAQIESAAPLGDDVVQSLKKALERRTGKQVELDVEVDPSLLGGIRATVGSTVLDGTLRSQLDQLKETLSRA
jgi:F-type H+-transporting ATPase subunit delta